jgi:hypothetical protein
MPFLFKTNVLMTSLKIKFVEKMLLPGLSCSCHICSDNICANDICSNAQMFQNVLQWYLFNISSTDFSSNNISFNGIFYDEIKKTCVFEIIKINNKFLDNKIWQEQVLLENSQQHQHSGRTLASSSYGQGSNPASFGTRIS